MGAKGKIRAIAVMGLALILPGCATVGTPSPALAAGDWVLDGVTIVDVRTGGLSPQRAIVISRGRIGKIVAAGTITSRNAVRIIDGGGAFVVPGYNDMHAHNLNDTSPETSLPLMVAHGVTGFRQMAGLPQVLAEHAAGTLILPAVSPELLAMPGPVLAGPTVASSEGAKAEVDRQKKLGADFIKVVDLPPAAFLAAADEAEALGLPYSGHLPANVDPRDAMAHGMDAIEHMGPTISLLVSCSRDEDQIRAILNAAPAGGRGIDFNMAPEKLVRLLANPVLLTPPQGFAMIDRVLATYDEDKCRALAQAFAASGTWIVPTLTRLEAMQLGNAPALRNNPALRFVPAATRLMWRDVGQDFESKLSAEHRKTLSNLFDRQLAMTKLFDEEDVKMLAGTDFGGQWIVSGQSMHHEFDLLARAGVPPLHILQMTTLDPARYLKRESDMGSVETGKAANLVLLNADPTKDAANLHAIKAVVRAGEFIDRARLDDIMAKAEATLHR